MKVLYLTPGCFDKGGISRYTRYQIEALRRIVGRDRVIALSLLGPGSDDFESPFEVAWNGRANVTIGSKAQFVRQAYTIARRERPSIIWAAHCHLSGLANLLARVAGASTVVNAYGHEVWSGPSADARWGLRRSELLVADCHFTAEYLQSTGVRTSANSLVIWDCVDTERFVPGPAESETLCRYGIPTPEQHFIILTVGRVADGARHKGYERLLTVFSRVARQCERARLVIGGDGNLIGSLKQQARALDVEKLVTFTGSIHESDLVQVFRSASVFSLVSDRGKNRGEGLPLTPLEAGACGVPILVGNQDGSQEAVVDGSNGRVLDPFDLDAHAATLLDLADHAPRLEALARNARVVVEREFSFGRFLERHAGLMSRLEASSLSSSRRSLAQKVV